MQAKIRDNKYLKILDKKLSHKVLIKRMCQAKTDEEILTIARQIIAVEHFVPTLKIEIIKEIYHE